MKAVFENDGNLREKDYFWGRNTGIFVCTSQGTDKSVCVTFFIKIKTMYRCVLIFCLLISINLSAQDRFPLFTAEAGGDKSDCFAKCMLPAVLDTISESILKTPQSSHYEMTAAVFDTIIETIEITPPLTIYEIIPAVYDTIREEIVIRDGVNMPISNEEKEDADCIEIFTEKIETAPPLKRWTRKLNENCDFETEGDKCYYWLLTDIPETYEVTKVEINNCANEPPKTERSAPENQTITRLQLRTPAQVREVYIPAEMQEVTRLLLRQDANANLINVPAKYEVIDKLILVRQGGEIEMRTVWCDKKAAENMNKIQKTLKKRGYYKGKTKGEWSQKTQNALLEFQQENNLPIGQFDEETMKMLGF